MMVYRIVKTLARTMDMSGMGAKLNGGRWNLEGTPALYTSERRSLCLLESLVHFDDSELPPELYIMNIEVDDAAPILSLTEDEMPAAWRMVEYYVLKAKGDELLHENKWLGIKVPSAVLPKEFNFILNPNHLQYAKWVRVAEVELYEPDKRLK